jgi:hypothetical protein
MSLPREEPTPGVGNLESATAHSTPVDQSSDHLHALADTIKRSGLVEPATLLLHTIKPLSWVGGQMLWVLQPFVEGLGLGRRSPMSLPGLAHLLEHEGSVDDLIERLHTPAEGGQQ